MTDSASPAMGVIAPLLALALAFAVGSLPTAYLFGRIKGIDIRQHGSGNVGATNAFRVLGKAIGITCLLIDVLKGWLPVTLFSVLGWGAQMWRPDSLAPATWMIVVGFAAIAGHSFSPWLGFRGGKGVATSLGVFLAIAPLAVLICLAVGAALIALTGYVSLASISGAALLPILILAFSTPGQRPWPLIALTAALGAFVIWRHRSNVARLVAGTEGKLFGARSTPDAEGEPAAEENKP